MTGLTTVKIKELIETNQVATTDYMVLEKPTGTFKCEARYLKGATGPIPEIRIGDTTTLPPGQSATVTKTGSNEVPIFNFGIPQGLQGPQGIQGLPGPSSVAINDNLTDVSHTWSSQKISDNFDGITEIQDVAYSTDKGYLVCQNTKNGSVKDLVIKGRTLIVNSNNEEVFPGTEGATLKSVGEDVDKIEVLTRSKDIKKVISENTESTKVQLRIEPIAGNHFVDNTHNKEIRLAIHKSGSWLKDIRISGNTCSYITLEEGESIYYILGYKDVGNSNVKDLYKVIIFDEQDKKPLLYKDATDNTWKPIPYLTEFDVVDSVKGKWYKRGVKEVLNGSEDYGLYGTVTNFRQGFLSAKTYNSNKPSMTGIKAPIISDKFKTISQNDVYYDLDGEGIGISITDKIVINIDKTKLETQDVAGFKKWLQTNNVTVVYELLQEEVYDIVPISLDAYEGETLVQCSSGSISPVMDFKLTSSLASLILNNTKRIGYLEDNVFQVVKSMLAGDFRTAAEILYPNDFIEDTSQTPEVLI